MSLRKSKLDLLVRVRYSNPLPPPPFPPKLLTIATSPARYADPSFTDRLASETALPMFVDADLGMPLDLGQWEALWDPEDKAADALLNPKDDALPDLDPRDAFMLSDTLVAETPSNGHASGAHTPVASVPTSMPGTPAPTPAWLRKTEYLSRDSAARQHFFLPDDKEDVGPVDVSREAQIRDIESTFPSSTKPIDLSTLKHPTKPGLTAVAVYDAFPDTELWANEYDLFKFAERPGERPADQEDTRLDCAVLRPMESDGDHFLAYYLTKDDDASERFKSRRRGQYGETDPSTTPFQFVRDYETVKIEREVPNEFVLVLDDGDLPPARVGTTGPLATRPRGAYYKNIERKITLKKKRVNKYDTAYTDKWDVITLSRIPIAGDEERDRAEAVAIVQDSDYWEKLAAQAREKHARDVMANLMGGDLDDL
ncbi:hypothetical protein EXIGLDRAFT_648223 [Exidia glandulosa HHB12029]|uniref:RNA polymerase II-associated n=1 Tax=Exidia glandulosa HHB12029 TaxID=1314781 RepID=A0A166AFY7_EXIGL|nr:hypothetical protein EXIGLDRAFT_648223 [Exidia glandulosa HHB12029]